MDKAIESSSCQISELSTNCYLIISNISKKSNVCKLIQTAAAYDFKCIVVGMNAIAEKDLIGFDFIAMKDLTEVSAFLSARNIKLIGIELSKDSESINSFQFDSNIAIMPGNEGDSIIFNKF